MKDNLMLTLDDAVKVAKRFTDMDEKVLRSELEQKCWMSAFDDEPLKRLIDLIMDIHPAEIASHIEHDNLKEWCVIMQTEMQLALIRSGIWEK